MSKKNINSFNNEFIEYLKESLKVSDSLIKIANDILMAKNECYVNIKNRCHIINNDILSLKIMLMHVLSLLKIVLTHILSLLKIVLTHILSLLKINWMLVLALMISLLKIVLTHVLALMISLLKIK